MFVHIFKQVYICEVYVLNILGGSSQLGSLKNNPYASPHSVGLSNNWVVYGEKTVMTNGMILQVLLSWFINPKKYYHNPLKIYHVRYPNKIPQ